jgi:hypothetical protein
MEMRCKCWGDPEREPAMSIIPLHLQRRFEQRWAARFGSPGISAVPKKVGLKGAPVNMCCARQEPKKNRKPECEAAGPT